MRGTGTSQNDSSTMETTMNYLLANGPALGVIVTGAGVIVTIVLFALQSARSTRHARTAARREVVSRVIDTVERASRAYALYPISKLWTRPEMELLLVLPRLVLALDSRERDIAVWVARQVQRMQLEKSEKRAIAVAQTVGFHLAEWHHGQRPLSWFKSQLETDPYDPRFSVPRQIRLGRGFRQFRDMIVVVGAAGILRLAWRRTFEA